MEQAYLLPDEIVRLAAQVVAENREQGRRVAVAESCTGGLVAAALTEIAGSSDVLERGFVTYSNAAKMEDLHVASDLIETFGAVSVACVWAMAQGALLRSKADIAVAISGVAGPGGGTPMKPVGTVVFARALRGQVRHEDTELRQFATSNRADVRREATLCALQLLLPRESDLAFRSA